MSFNSSISQVGRPVPRVRAVNADVLAFSSGHFLLLAARWLGLQAIAGRYFYLGAAAVSAGGTSITKGSR